MPNTFLSSGAVMHFIPLTIIAAVFFITPVLYAVAIYHVWRKEGSLRPHTRTIVAAGLMRLAVLLIGFQLLLTALGRSIPFAPFSFSIALLGFGSIGIRVVGVVNHLLVLLVGVYVFLGISQRSVPPALVILIGLLALASGVIGVRSAIRDARSGSARTSPRSNQK